MFKNFFSLKKYVASQIQKTVENSMENPTENFWEKLRSVYQTLRDTVIGEFSQNFAFSFDAETQEISEKSAEIDKALFTACKNKFVEKSGYLHVILKEV